MMLWKASVFILLFAATFAKDDDGPVLELSDRTFEMALRSSNIIMIMFYAPWCGHCKALKPEFKQAAEFLQKNVTEAILAKIDCTLEGKSTCQKYKIDGYPTLKVFRDLGSSHKDYDGPREYDAIVKYMKRQVEKSAVNLRCADEFSKFVLPTEVSIVGFFEANSDLNEAFWKLAEERHPDYRFGHCSNKELLEEHNIRNGVVVYRPKNLRNKFEDNIAVYTGTAEGLKDFVKKNYHGLVAVRTDDNKNKLKTPLAIVYFEIDFVMNPKGTNYWRNRVLKVAKHFEEHRMNFAMSDKNEFDNEITQYGLSEADSTKPICCVLMEKNEKYVVKKEFSVEAFQKFVEDVENGLVEPHIKSQPIPKKNDKPVKVAVGKTFNDMVINNGRDTFVAFYAPWCGHCKKLKPVYNKLGKKMLGENVDIVKFDATSNDYPHLYNVEGFPTLFWVPKDRKHQIVKYEGGHKIDDLIKYIAAHSTDELKNYDRNGTEKSTMKKTEL